MSVERKREIRQVKRLGGNLEASGVSYKSYSKYLQLSAERACCVAVEWTQGRWLQAQEDGER